MHFQQQDKSMACGERIHRMMPTQRAYMETQQQERVAARWAYMVQHPDFPTEQQACLEVLPELREFFTVCAEMPQVLLPTVQHGEQTHLLPVCMVVPELLQLNTAQECW